MNEHNGEELTPSGAGQEVLLQQTSTHHLTRPEVAAPGCSPEVKAARKAVRPNLQAETDPQNPENSPYIYQYASSRIHLEER